MKNNLFSSYKTDVFFDEMFGKDGTEALDHYHAVFNRLKTLDPNQIEEKQKQADSSFLEHGVTFTVYGDGEGTERIFPFDLIPEETWTQLQPMGRLPTVSFQDLFYSFLY